MSVDELLQSFNHPPAGYQGRPRHLGQPFAVRCGSFGARAGVSTSGDSTPQSSNHPPAGYQGRPRHLGQPFAVSCCSFGTGEFLSTAGTTSPIRIPLSTPTCPQFQETVCTAPEFA